MLKILPSCILGDAVRYSENPVVRNENSTSETTPPIAGGATPMSGEVVRSSYAPHFYQHSHCGIARKHALCVEAAEG